MYNVQAHIEWDIVVNRIATAVTKSATSGTSIPVRRER